MSEQKVINGDSLDILKTFSENQFDSIVSDPPYGLSFMGKKWDYDVPSVELWKEAFRVLKSGGYILVACGTRTQHRMAVNIEDAGFEIRDVITWHYGSGFPKSLDVSKAIDKQAGVERKVIGQREDILTKQSADIKSGKRKIVDSLNAGAPERNNGFTTVSADITEPATEEAKKWQGWGTALKPSTEFWTLARKPLSEKTVADNVIKHGTGGINIDGCRVSTDELISNHSRGEESAVSKGKYVIVETHQTSGQALGRFPANLILSHHPDCICIGKKQVRGSNSKPSDIGKGREGDFTNGIYGAKQSKVTASHVDENGNEEVEDWNCHEDCPLKIMDEQSGISKSSGGSGDKSMGALGKNGKYGKFALNTLADNAGGLGDIGGASRFFYCAKASKSERSKGLEINNHPTVKPVKLMQYLVRMITPPNGLCLDPYNGSGTTGIACKLEGVNYIGIEREKEYCDISEARIKAWGEEEPKEVKTEAKKTDSGQAELF